MPPLDARGRRRGKPPWRVVAVAAQRLDVGFGRCHVTVRQQRREGHQGVLGATWAVAPSLPFFRRDNESRSRGIRPALEAGCGIEAASARGHTQEASDEAEGREAYPI